MREIKRALLSVFYKDGVVDFAKSLAAKGVVLYSTGGTWQAIHDAGISVEKVEDYTGYPEMMNGRVKTLHPKIHGGILAKRDNPEHMEALNKHGMVPFDLVAVNLYPFRETVEQGGSFEAIIEKIDIGGPTMVRSAAKNFRDVAIVTDPTDYLNILSEMEKNDNHLSLPTRFSLSAKAFSHTASYDGYIASYLSTINHQGEVEREHPDMLHLHFIKSKELRYGENPHQAATLYVNPVACKGDLASAIPLQGKQLSFNNYIDLDAAKGIVQEFSQPAVAIMKHTNPCGLAIGRDVLDAYVSALETDPVSAFGSVIGTNREVGQETAEMMRSLFVEAVIAPSFSPAALEIFAKKKNLRLIATGIMEVSDKSDYEYKKISGGLLIESKDRFVLTPNYFTVVSDRKPTEEEMNALLFAQKAVKHVKSNAIIIARNHRAVGIGAGQMSRIDALEKAIVKSRSEIKGCVLSSDAFFPFRDSVDRAAEVGIVAIIQPGGSKRDDEVIAACNEHNIAMVFTGVRTFRHL
ncbi:bifunctional phosphoribosylaminoimidazolecarboxamide formyltransferase/IMP cyclohydrolase [bacterium]|nr:bifunctional phosphoribosylaminoimidazolecarboxamide formyltransferase/IMP cyclohydrolase [bacterium]